MKRLFGMRPQIGIGVLDAVIVLGILAIAVLIPVLSATGGFCVSFDSNGGTHVASVSVRYGESIPLPEAPTKEGATFLGWYYDSQGEEPFDPKRVVASSGTLYAMWSEEP